MPLKTIKIQNFQSHEKTKIELDPMITTIIGSTDSGKTAVLRALRWLTHNLPSGEAFVREGSPGCAVSLEFDDHKITRRRGKDVNEYIVDGKTLRAFGQSTPSIVGETLKTSDLNYQMQHDAPFWFSLSSGEVSRKLNEIVDLELIDRCLSSVNKRLQKSTAEVEVSKSRLEASKQKVESLNWAEEAQKEWKKIESLEDQVEHLKGTVTSLLTRIQTLTTLIMKFREASAILESLTKIITLGEDRREKKSKLAVLEKIISSCREYSTVSVPDASILEQKIRAWKGLLDRATNVGESIHRIRECGLARNQPLAEKTKVDEEINKKLEGKCPICKRPL